MVVMEPHARKTPKALHQALQGEEMQDILGLHLWALQKKRVGREEHLPEVSITCPALSLSLSGNIFDCFKKCFSYLSSIQDEK